MCNEDNIVYLIMNAYKLIYKEYTSEEVECIIYSLMSERRAGRWGSSFGRVPTFWRELFSQARLLVGVSIVSKPSVGS